MDKFEETAILRRGFPSYSQFFLTSEEKHNVVFMRLDINMDSYSDYHFLLLAKTVHKLGHNVCIVTNNSHPMLSQIVPKAIPVYQVGSWIPVKIFRKYDAPLWFVRAIYTSLWIIIHKYSLKPSLIITQSVNTVSPVLKFFGRFPIVQIYNFRDSQMLKRLKVRFGPITEGYYKLCIDSCDRIIVRNNISKSIFTDCFGSIDKKISIIYPTIEPALFQKCPIKNLTNFSEIPENALIFVQFESQRYESNFEISYFAYIELMIKVRYFRDLPGPIYLVIACEYGDNQMFDTFVQRIHAVYNAEAPGYYCLICLMASQTQYRKSLLSKCVALLHPSLGDINPRSILEAGLMKKPVIACNFGIAKELIVHGKNGFLVNQTPSHYAKYMCHLLYNEEELIKYSLQAHLHFLKFYGMSRLEREMQNIIKRHAIKE